MSDGEVYVTFGADASGLNAAFDGVRARAVQLNGQMTEVARVMDSTGRVAEIDLGRGLNVVGNRLRDVNLQHAAYIEGMKGVDLSLRQSVASHAQAAHAILQTGTSALQGAHALNALGLSFKKFAALAGVSFSADALKNWVEQTIAAGDALDKEAARYGESLQDIQSLHGIATVGGANGPALVSALSALQTQLRKSKDDADKTAAAFHAVGLSFDDMKGKSPLQLLEAIAQAFSHYADGANKAAVAKELLGNAGVDLIRQLDEGKQGFEDLEAAVQRTGSAMSDATVAALAKTQRDLNELKLAWNSAIFAGVVPAVDGGVRAITQLIESIDPSKVKAPLQQFGDDFIQFSGSVIEACYRAQTAWEKFVNGVNGLDAKINNAQPAWLQKTQDSLNDWAKNGPPLAAMWSSIERGFGFVTKTAGALPGNVNAAGAAGVAAFGGLDVAATKSALAIEHIRDATKAAKADFDRLAGVSHASPHSDAAIGGTAYYGNAAIRPGSPAGPQAGVIPDSSGGSSGGDSAYAAANNAFQKEVVAAQTAAQEIALSQNGLLERHRITTQQWLASSLAAIDKEQDAIQDAADKAIATDGLTSQQRDRIATAEAEKMKELYGEIARAQNKAADDTERKWQSAFNQINSAFDSQIDGLLRGTTSWGQAFRNVLATLTENVVKFFVNWGLQASERFVEDQVQNAARVAGHVAGNATMAASDQASAAAGGLAWIGQALKTLEADAASVFGGVFAFMAPALGPAAAGPAAAASGAVLAGAGAIASADIGMWQVPGDQLAMIHHNELIMPAPEAGAFRSLLSGMVGGGSAGGSVTHNHTWNISSNARDPRQVAKEVVAQLDRNPSLRFKY